MRWHPIINRRWATHALATVSLTGLAAFALARPLPLSSIPNLSRLPEQTRLAPLPVSEPTEEPPPIPGRSPLAAQFPSVAVPLVKIDFEDVVDTLPRPVLRKPLPEVPMAVPVAPRSEAAPKATVPSLLPDIDVPIFLPPLPKPIDVTQQPKVFLSKPSVVEIRSNPVEQLPAVPSLTDMLQKKPIDAPPVPPVQPIAEPKDLTPKPAPAPTPTATSSTGIPPAPPAPVTPPAPKPIAAPAIAVGPNAVSSGVPVRPGDPKPVTAPQVVGVPCPCSGFDFSKVPQNVRPQPRLGNFSILPTGPGYYSVLDLLRGKCRENPPKYPYPRFALMGQSFFDVDWRYLDDPKNTDHDPSDMLKRMNVGDNFMLSLGGQASMRYMNEYNSRLTQSNNIYLLARTRAYADLWYKDIARVYVEGIYTDTEWQDLAPLPIDNTGPDFLNLFVDLKLGDFRGKPAYLRFGRQELLFGSQRLISTLDWANTRRTFQGVRVTRTGEKWDLDAFWVQPVIPNPVKLDWADNQQNFAGAWATYRPNKSQTVDLYNLVLTNDNTVVQQGIQRGQFTLNTFGGRYVGSHANGFLWDFEGAMQLGRRNGQDVVAGMGTAGVGYNFKNAPLNPTFWAYYDYASGSNTPGTGTSHTFNQLFPFGHYYLGWADQVGRQNMQDLNFHMYLYPSKWCTVWLQYHRFWLASSKDALYNAAGNATRRDPTGLAGNDIGQEVDAVLNFHLSNRDDLLVGYSYLFGGNFLKATSSATAAPNSGMFFAQYNLRW